MGKEQAMETHETGDEGIKYKVEIDDSARGGERAYRGMG